LGADAKANALAATAIGSNTNFGGPPGDRSTAIGSNANALSDDTTAVGQNSLARGNFASAFGKNSSADGDNAVAIGANALATTVNSTAVGNTATASGGGISVGQFAGDTNGTGFLAQGSSILNIAIGASSGQHVTGSNNIALGTFAGRAVFGDGNINIGSQVAAQLGTLAAPVSDTVAMGRGSFASNNHAVAIGSVAKASGVSSVALGDAATASADGAVAIGLNSTSSGAFAIAIGSGATATGSIAVGNVASAANGGAAFGDNATATGTNAAALGAGATATFANSTAIGAGATTTRANQVTVGAGTSTYTMPGINSAASLAAQSGSTRIVTSDANGNLATAAFSPADISGLQNNVSVLQGNVVALQQQMRQSFEGTAMAIAMGGSSLPGDKRFAISTNWGTFRGENAAAVLAQARVNEYIVLNAGLAAGFAQGGVGGRAGVTFAW
jgi:hypothetical protein